MSRKHARLLAGQVLREAKVKRPPIRLGKLLKVHAIGLERTKLDRHVSSVLLTGASSRILVNGKLGRDQRRFSVAHSLGHHFLHQGKATVFVTDLTIHARTHPPARTDPAEAEANAFALELLMPEHHLREDLQSGHGTDLSDGDALGRLADRYRVSPAILALRAERLGLLWGL